MISSAMAPLLWPIPVEFFSTNDPQAYLWMSYTFWDVIRETAAPLVNEAIDQGHQSTRCCPPTVLQNVRENW